MTTSPKTVCACGKGYASAFDQKCGYCRSKKETKAREDQEYRERRDLQARQQVIAEIQAKIQRVNQ